MKLSGSGSNSGMIRKNSDWFGMNFNSKLSPGKFFLIWFFIWFLTLFDHQKNMKNTSRKSLEVNDNFLGDGAIVIVIACFSALRHGKTWTALVLTNKKLGITDVTFSCNWTFITFRIYRSYWRWSFFSWLFWRRTGSCIYFNFWLHMNTNWLMIIMSWKTISVQSKVFFSVT